MSRNCFIYYLWFCLFTILLIKAQISCADVSPQVVIPTSASQELYSVATNFAAFLSEGMKREIAVKKSDWHKNSIWLGTLSESRKSIESFMTGIKMHNSNACSEIISAIDKLSKVGDEGVWIKGFTGTVFIIGNSDLAVKHGTYIYLENLGYRWFFPHPAWRIIPEIKNYATAFEYLGEPSFKNRRIWYAYGTASKQCDEDYKKWAEFNRQGGSFEVHCGHAWGGIIRRNVKEFEAHPEFFALTKNGERATNVVFEARKFCVSNDQLINLCINDTLSLIEKEQGIAQTNTAKDGDKKVGESNKQVKNIMISLEPTDGIGCCYCDKCRKIGGESEQVFYLANKVAAEVSKKYPGSMIGLYAYAGHAMPPSFDLATNIYVQIATAYNKTPLTLHQLIVEWKKKIKNVGIREYYGVMAWDWDMPGQPRGAKVSYIAKSLSEFYNAGVNAINAESNVGWISRGLGHYIAAKLMWDISLNVEALKKDFIEKSFGNSWGPMTELYDDWENTLDPLPTPHSIGKWNRLVNEALALCEDEKIKERLYQIQYYLHFVALFYNWKTAKTSVETNAYTALLEYAWRIKDFGVCASYPLARRIANSKAPAPEYRFNAPDCIWQKNTEKVTYSELKQMINADMERYKEIKGITVFPRTGQFKPATTQIFPRVINRFRFPHEFILQIPSEGESAIMIALGFIYKEVYEHPVRIYSLDDTVEDENAKPVFEVMVKGDGISRRIELASLKHGFYKMIVDDRKSGFEINPVADTKLTILADAFSRVRTIGRSSFIFMVPQGVKKFVIISDGPLALLKPDGTKLTKPQGNMWEVEVGEGESGIWRILEQAGMFYLAGVPPFVALSPQDLIIPE